MYVLATIGGLTIICIVICVLIGVYYWAREKLEESVYEYRYKHRFDNPPTAKCYCVDCVRWCKDNGKCGKFDGWHTADCWFCWDAEPKTLKQVKREEKNS